MLIPQRLNSAVFYLVVLLFPLTIAGCQNENPNHRIKGYPLGAASTQSNSNSTSDRTSTSTTTSTSSSDSSTSPSSATNSTTATSPSPPKSGSKVKPPYVPKNVEPLSSEHYEWEEGVFNFRGEYNSRCVFPKTEPHAKGTMLDELFAWRDIVQQSYLLSDELVDLDPREYVKTFTDYDSYVEVMTNKDSYIQKLRSFIPKASGELKHAPYEIAVESSKRPVQNLYNFKPESFTFGIKWKSFSDTVPRDFRVKFVLKNSTASKAILDGLRIKRGDRLIKVNNIDFVNNEDEASVEQLVEALKPKKVNESIRLTFKDKDTKRNKSIVLKSFKEDEANDLHVSKIIETESGNVGYLHIGTTGHVIIQYDKNIETFFQNDVKDVIVDMRYFNEREFFWTESKAESSLAFMIVGESKTRGPGPESLLGFAKGRKHYGSRGTYKTYRLSGKFVLKSDTDSLKSDTRRFLYNDRVVFYSFCPEAMAGNPPIYFLKCVHGFLDWRILSFGMRPLHPVFFFPYSTLNLDRVFLLVSRETCSMAEAFINAFRGVDVEVILVGENTCGDIYYRGKYVNCGISIDLVTRRFVNHKLFGDYEDGFKPENSPSKFGVSVPGCYVKDDLTKPLGDEDEALLAAALQYRNDKTCPPID